MVDKAQPEGDLHPEEPPWQQEETPWRIEKPSDEHSAAWRLAWAVVGVVVFLAVMYGFGL